MESRRGAFVVSYAKRSCYKKDMYILGIETSCDDTAMAVVEARGGKTKPQFRVLANEISSQIETHQKFGGVVPTLAAREHAKNFVPVLEQTLAGADVSLNDIDLIAVTTHPGLMPSLVVGVHAARGLAWALKKPILGVNHLYGHVVANLLPEIRGNSKHQITNSKKRSSSQFPVSNFQFPLIALIVSGGHTQLVLMRDITQMEIIGETRDDAAGEAFDKVAKLLGLPFPGGPPVERLAAQQQSEVGSQQSTVELPRPMIGSDNFDFSFSGLKTAVLYCVQEFEKKNEPIPKAAVCAEFQQAVVDVLVAKTLKAAKQYRAKIVLLGGGVAANKELRRRLAKTLTENHIPNFRFPISPFSLDNGAMIAAAAYLRWAHMNETQRTSATWETVDVGV